MAAGGRSADAVAYACTAIAATLIAVSVLGVDWRSLSVPFAYGSDVSFTQAILKGWLENGSFQVNSRLGAPGGLFLYDFPANHDVAHLLSLNLISWFAGDWVRTINLYYLAGYALCALSATYALRQLGIGRGPAAVAGILYSLLPYHFLRGEQHLALASYQAVPLGALLALRVALGQSAWSIGGFLICALLATSGLYYAYFACFFLMVAGLLGAAWQKKVAPLIEGGGLALAAGAVGALVLLPNVFYWWKNGGNPEALIRVPRESEFGAFKIAQLLLPATGHRIEALARFMDRYNAESVLISENYMATLGIIGAAGLVLLVFCLLARSRRGDLLDALAGCALAGLLLGTMGGGGSLVALVAPSFRGYNRVSVYLAFFSLAAVAAALERLRSAWIRGAACGLVLLFGVLDQTNGRYAIAVPAIRKQVESDRRMVARIEAALPADSLIFQMPYLPFPEAGLTHHRMLDYDHFKGYLQGRTLRWSYGSMRGRHGDWWYRTVYQQPIPARLGTLARSGFGGIWLDRFGYPASDETEDDLEDELGEPLVSDDGRYAFFDLRPLAEKLLAGRPADEIARLRRLALDDPEELGGATPPAWKPGALAKGTAGFFDHVRPARCEAHCVLHAEGWAADRGRNQPAKGVLVAEGERAIYFLPHTGGERPDVARVFHEPRLFRSGWRVSVPLDGLGKGRHRLRFYAMLADGSFAELEGRAEVTIR